MKYAHRLSAECRANQKAKDAANGQECLELIRVKPRTLKQLMRELKATETVIYHALATIRGEIQTVGQNPAVYEISKFTR